MTAFLNRDHVSVLDLVCGSCGGSGKDRDPTYGGEIECFSCRRTGLDLDMLASALNAVLQLAKRPMPAEAPAPTSNDGRCDVCGFASPWPGGVCPNVRSHPRTRR